VTIANASALRAATEAATICARRPLAPTALSPDVTQSWPTCRTSSALPLVPSWRVAGHARPSPYPTATPASLCRTPPSVPRVPGLSTLAGFSACTPISLAGATRPAGSDHVRRAFHLLAETREGLVDEARQRLRDMGDAIGFFCDGFAGEVFNRDGDIWAGDGRDARGSRPLRAGGLRGAPRDLAHLAPERREQHRQARPAQRALDRGGRRRGAHRHHAPAGQPLPGQDRQDVAQTRRLAVARDAEPRGFPGGGPQAPQHDRVVDLPRPWRGSWRASAGATGPPRIPPGRSPRRPGAWRSPATVGTRWRPGSR